MTVTISATVVSSVSQKGDCCFQGAVLIILLNYKSFHNLSNSCMKYKSPGGLWDTEDDCCERRFVQHLPKAFLMVFSIVLLLGFLNCVFRCTSDHPCTHGEGHCTSDSDCERYEYGYHTCSEPCIGWYSLTNTNTNTNTNTDTTPVVNLA